MFERKGRFLVDPAAGGGGPAERKLDEDHLLEIVLEAGADDLQAEGDAFAIYCRLAAFADVNHALAARRVPLREAGLAYVPNQRITVADEAVATRLVRLIDALEDNDDVQGVFSNEDFPEAVVRALEA